MDQSLVKKRRLGSWLHRVLHITPGYASNFLLSPDSCLGFDMLVVINGILFLGISGLLHIYGIKWGWVVGLFIGLVFMIFIVVPFENRERFGRARRRRGECVWCGQMGIVSGSVCTNCGCNNEAKNKK